MSLSYYNPFDRYRQRKFERLSAVFIMLVFVAIAAYAGFLMGQGMVGQETLRARKDVADLKAERDTLMQDVTDLRAQIQTINARFEQLQKSYTDAVPGGPVGDLVALIRKQIEEGRDPERIAYLVRSGRPPKNCTDPEARRFVVSTPNYKGPESSVALAEGGIKITASGVSARNEKGDPEAWYDPSQSIRIAVAVAGLPVKEKAGVMPLTHTVIHGGREYRISVTESARSFAKVTFDSCDYP